MIECQKEFFLIYIIAHFYIAKRYFNIHIYIYIYIYIYNLILNFISYLFIK